jgi:phosphate:Na+ symporter
MLEMFALYLAGLSFFFSGLTGVSDNLRQLSGQRFRQVLSRLTHRPLMAGLVGAAFGAVTQSASVVAFILSGMVSSGLLPISRALVVLACANIGTACLVFFAASDLHLSILFLIGISGLLLASNIIRRWKPAAASAMSIGILFLGLEMMKQAFEPLSSSPSFLRVARFLVQRPAAAFAIGALLRGFIHSSSAVAAIAITFNRGGQIGAFPAMMLIAGLGLGSALATWFLAANLRGVPRQIAMYQAITNCIASLLMAAMLLLEHITSIPLLMTATQVFRATVTQRMAFTYLALNITVAIVAVAGLRWAPGLLARLWPPTPEQDLSRLLYLEHDSLNAPETALDLVAMEQLRIMRAMGSSLSAARSGDAMSPVRIHSAASHLGFRIAEFLDEMMRLPLAPELATRTIGFQRKQASLRSLEENVHLFVQSISGHTREVLASLLLESLDTILLTATAALESGEPLEIELLIGMTEDRSGMMEELRGRFGLHQIENTGSLSAIHYATTLFERNVWLLRQLALWLREDLKLAAA